MMIKKVIIGGLILVGSALGVKAYQYSKMSPEEKVERMTQKIAHKLKLSEEQIAQVRKINLERSEMHLKAYENGRDKEMLITAVKDWENKMKEVLTEDQSKKLGI